MMYKTIFLRKKYEFALISTLFKILFNKFDSLHPVSLDVFITYKDLKKSVLFIDIYKAIYEIRNLPVFVEYKGEAKDHSIVIKLKDTEVYSTLNNETVSGVNKYGYLYLPKAKLNSNFIVDEFITFPRVFDEIPFVKNNGKYMFYNFIKNEQLGKIYNSYKNIPIYETILGIYDNGVEIVDNKKVYNFNIGIVKSVKFETIGNFVYAIITTSKTNYKLDVWNKAIASKL